ncbi:MAG: sodium:calcium antiporter [Methanohalobium sp.]|uniref:sodium:calcium antiporter n=1 Tax=Methanohalobium sp. TaxID=2837493 RepID=UPI003979724B
MELLSAIIIFLGFTAVIGVAGTYLSRTADQFADITGLGEVLLGAMFLGATTSMAGIITSVTAAFQNYPELAISNAMGGIVAQTSFLAIVDITYRKANLEHASASYENLMQGMLLVIMLSFILLVMVAPNIGILDFHPASLVLILIYVLGLRLVSKSRNVPMWKPRKTPETIEDIPKHTETEKINLKTLSIRFLILAVSVAISGYMVAESGIVIAQETGLSESFVGSLFTAVSTSLPELIVTVSAVRYGALTLAVSNIIGGNSFDVLFVAFSDFAYLQGSIYHALSYSQVFIIVLTLLITSVLIMGLLDREKNGIGNIGWESFLIILLFVGGYIVMYIS